MKYILAIDPSLRSLGWALFKIKKQKDKKPKVSLFKSGQFKAADTTKDFKFYLLNRSGLPNPVLANKGIHDANDWVLRIDYMTGKVYEAWCAWTQQCDDTTVVIELPYGAQANNAGDITKLTSLCFALREMFLIEDDVSQVYYAPVGVWKGQLSKELTQKRMNRLWGLTLDSKRADEADAVGIGSYYIREHLEMGCGK